MEYFSTRSEARPFTEAIGEPFWEHFPPLPMLTRRYSINTVNNAVWQVTSSLQPGAAPTFRAVKGDGGKPTLGLAPNPKRQTV